MNTGEDREKEAARQAAIAVLRDWGKHAYNPTKRARYNNLAARLEIEQHTTESNRQNGSNNPLHKGW